MMPRSVAGTVCAVLVLMAISATTASATDAPRFALRASSVELLNETPDARFALRAPEARLHARSASGDGRYVLSAPTKLAPEACAATQGGSIFRNGFEGP